MITFIKKLFGLEKPAVAEAKTEAPYKVEVAPMVDTADIAIAQLPTPVAVVVAEIVPVSFSEIPVSVAPTEAPAKPKATVKKQQPKKKAVVAKPPTAAKTPPKPRAPRKPAVK